MTMQPYVLIVEDEESIAAIEKAYLEKAGFSVDTAKEGKEALSMIDQKRPDLLVLDLMLPEMSGEELLGRIRETHHFPVIIVSAKSEEEDKVENFQRGADDYLTKPFSARELVARVKAVLRRSESRKPQKNELVTSDRRITLDLDSMRVFKDQEEIHLTKNEFSILHSLFTHPDKIFTRDEIIELAFGHDYEAYDRAVDTHIKNIRQKIEDDPKKPKYIQTVYGVGYRVGGF